MQAGMKSSALPMVFFLFSAIHCVNCNDTHSKFLLDKCQLAVYAKSFWKSSSCLPSIVKHEQVLAWSTHALWIILTDKSCRKFVLLAANTSSSKALFDVGVEMGGSLTYCKLHLLSWSRTFHRVEWTGTGDRTALIDYVHYTQSEISNYRISANLGDLLISLVWNLKFVNRVHFFSCLPANRIFVKFFLHTGTHAQQTQVSFHAENFIQYVFLAFLSQNPRINSKKRDNTT